MKGIVFTEFLEIVEQKFGYEVVDELLNTTELKSNGIYTAVGTYAHSEMVSLVYRLSEVTEVPTNVLLKTYGKHLFKSFSTMYFYLMKDIVGAFEFLNAIEEYIHVEVKKLYPDAELPHFSNEMINEYSLIMTYHSTRKMADLAEGLIESTFEHFKENATITRKNLKEDGSVVQFMITKNVEN